MSASLCRPRCARSPTASLVQLIVDTGSANTWVGARGGYVKTSTSKDTKRAVNVGYGGASFSGEEYTDQVTLGQVLCLFAL